MVNNSTGAKILFDYCPEDVSSVMRMLVPQVQEKSRWRSLLLGDLNVTWANKASVKFFRKWPKSYENLVRIARTTGKVANSFADWVRHEFAPTHTTFDPLEVMLTNGTYVRSTMCHDFVTDSLWVLYRKGVRLGASEPIFRDHIIMYAQAIQPIPSEEKTIRHRREFMRYLRLLRFFYTRIADQFTYGREALIINWKIGLPTYLRTKGVDWRVQITPPFLNYCYLPLAIPPKKHSLKDGNKLCALAMEANITNTSVGIERTPVGLEPGALTAEGRLDSDEAFGAIALVTFAAVLFVRPAKLSIDASKED